MDTFVPPCGAPHLDMSPGETGGSQYIASPLVQAYAAAGPLPQLPEDAAAADLEESEAHDAHTAHAEVPARQPLYPIFMVRAARPLRARVCVRCVCGALHGCVTRRLLRTAAWESVR
jgi:hypothetical protein